MPRLHIFEALNLAESYKSFIILPHGLSDMLNKYFIAQIAENTFILHW